MSARPTHRSAAAQAALVTVLWSTSFLLVKGVLPAVPPVTLAGVRYLLAFLLLVAYALFADRRRPQRLPWVLLATIGILQYGIGQAMQYAAMQVLPVATIALFFCLLTPFQAVADTLWLREPPLRAQLVGATVTLVGFTLYLPWGGPWAWPGLLLMIGVMIVTSIATTFSRQVAREGSASTLHLTLVSMGAGALVILPVGLAAEAAPRFPLPVVGALLWLSLANTAVAFSLWNSALRTLTAFQANVIGNTTLFQVGILGWLFLGESLSPRQILGIVVAFGGVLLAQLPARDVARAALTRPA